MFDFQQKRKFKTILTSRYTQGALLFLAFAIGWSAFTRYQIAVDMAERRYALEAEAALLEARKVDLKKQVDYLSEDRGIEAEMRRQFDVALEGEQVVVIVDPEEEERVLPLATSTPQKAWYEFWR